MKKYRNISTFSGILAILLAGMVCHDARAQFTASGSEPFRIRWKSIDSPSFRIIYPEKMDSLARVYGRELEAARIPLGMSSGYAPGSVYRKKMPVVLHPFHATANASVTWAPRRMDIYTVSDPFSPDGTPWPRDLALHEGRHLSQMQFTGDGFLFKTMRVLTGEAVAGALSAIFPGPALLEGDAVVAETALSEAGRGREYSFLNYMVPAFDCGDWRDYWKWTNRSLTRYSPDYYRGGYMLVAGTRVFFDDPLFMENYLRRTKNLRFFGLQHEVRAVSGMKFKKAFRSIQESFQEIWAEEAALRAPFQEMTQISPVPVFHTTYGGTASDGEGRLYARKSSLDRGGSLVRICPDGSEERLRSFASGVSPLKTDAAGGKIWWSEIRNDVRWDLKQSSDIRYISLDKPSKAYTLTKGRKYFNPAPSPDGSLLAVCEYADDGRYSVRLLDSASGEVSASYPMPDGIQPLESAWIGKDLFISGLLEQGYGIFRIKGLAYDGKAELETVAEPCHSVISSLGIWPGKTCLTFVSDRSGVDELYSLDISDGTFTRVTSTRYGISDPCFNPSGDTLYFSSLASSDNPERYTRGYMICSTAAERLVSGPAEIGKVHDFPVASALSAQEKALATQGTAADSAEFSEPKNYSRVRLPHIHSWLPLYVTYDDLMNLSLDVVNQMVQPGVSIFFQSLAGSGYGMAGYSHHKDLYSDDGKWRDGLHLEYTCTGWFPQFEFGLDVNERDRMQVRRYLTEKDGVTRFLSGGSLMDNSVSLEGSVKVYVPLDFSGGGISRGLVPQIKWSANNDLYDDLVYRMNYDEEKESYVNTEIMGEGGNSFMNLLTMSVRGYITRNMGASQVFPTLGIGAEAGLRTRPGHSRSYKSGFYLYTYGYLPGLGRLHGIKLTASYEKTFGKSAYSLPEVVVSRSPRGFVNSSLQSYLSRNYRSRTGVTIDYAIPFGAVDWSFLSPLAYIRNFTLTPFCDVSYNTYGSIKELNIGNDLVRNETLCSVGADLSVNLGNFLWFPFDTEFGVRYARNFWNTLEQEGVSNLKRNHVSFFFNIDF
ncbi:MAG: TolB family protein [Candidatus Cryptobacteroides sp.]